MKQILNKQSSFSLPALLLCFAFLLFFPVHANADTQSAQSTDVLYDVPDSLNTSPGALSTSPGALSTSPGALNTSPGALNTSPGAISTPEDIPTALPEAASGGGSQEAEADTPAAIHFSAVISQKKLVLTKGFSQKLHVKKYSGHITWVSSNKKIAAVDKNGKVTGKKTGTCTITAKCRGGKRSCKVSVKDNIYKEVRITLKLVKKKTACVQVYKAYYDSKGNIRVTLAIANHNQHNIESLKKMKIKFKSASRKKIAAYALNNRKVTIKKGQIKNVTFVIPKKNVLLKHADLRNAFSTVSGTYGYTKVTSFNKNKSKSKKK